MRRIVTGATPSGKSFIVSDGEPQRIDQFKSIPGFASALLWSSEPEDGLNFSGQDTTTTTKSFVPAPGGTRLVWMTFPPDAVRGGSDFDGVAFGAEFLTAMPGLAELFAPSGIHTTPTFDYAVVTDGEMTLEMDDGTMTIVRAGDVVVQNGTSHAWRNLSDRPATIIVALIGA